VRAVFVVALVLAACEEPRAAQIDASVPAPAAAVDVRAGDDAPPADEDGDDLGTRGVVVLVPLKSFPKDLLDEIETMLERELKVEVRRHEVEPLPRKAWYAPRRRYRADVLIDHLATFVEGEPETTKVLGLTEVDISTTNGDIPDWGIFGLGYAPGPSAVVSSFRLKRRAKSREHFRFRVANTALHEIGHTFGLQHCPEDKCPMQDAEGSIARTDASNGSLGPQCQALLDRLAPTR
jgi:archaemetzincin